VHGELIEAEHTGFLRDLLRHAAHRIGVLIMGLLTQPMQPIVHIRHEGVKMRAPLLFDRKRAEEQVHQEGFAAPDRSPKVEAARRPRSRAKGGEERLRHTGAFRPAACESVGERLQPLDRSALRRVALQRALRDERVIFLDDGLRTRRHARRILPLASASAPRRSSQ
jgi:hypothetical protein